MKPCCPNILRALPRCQSSPRSRDELAFHALQSLPMGANDWFALSERCRLKGEEMASAEFAGVVADLRTIGGVPVGTVVVGGGR